MPDIVTEVQRPINRDEFDINVQIRLMELEGQIRDTTQKLERLKRKRKFLQRYRSAAMRRDTLRNLTQ